MVSGFVTSPKDHDRIFSGDAREILIALKSLSVVGFAAKAIVSTTCSLRALLWTRVFRVPCRGSRFPSHSLLQQLHVEAQRLQLPHQDVERLRQPGIRG